MKLIQTTTTDENFSVRVEFEGNIYEAACSMAKLIDGARRCQFLFEHHMPQIVGIYRSENKNQMLADAEKRFLEFLQDLTRAKKL